MTSLEFAAQMSYASVDDGHGRDPRQAAVALLRELRVLAAMRDASREWSDSSEEAVVAIAVSNDGFVLTLTPEDTITRELGVGDLRARFADAGMTLWLEDPASDDELIDEYDYDEDDDPDEGFEDGDEGDVAEDDADLAALFAPDPVRVRAFSHRGPMEARLMAKMAKTDVAYAEVGLWSLVSFETAEPTEGWQPSKAQSPLITLNIPERGSTWVEVATHGVMASSHYFWPDAERDTLPVLDIDAITVPAAAETYRMLLAEGDGVHDELVALAERCDLDVELAHEALRSEALGGIAGADARLRAFLRAFDVPEELIEAAMSDAGAATLPDARRFEVKSWPQTAGDVILGGTWEGTALTRRSQPWARLSKALLENPLLALAVILGELALGAVLTVVLRRGWKTVGVLLVTDALGDLVVLWARMRRR